MNDYKELIEELKRNGLSNGGALGHHSSLCDVAAEVIEQLVRERDVLELQNHLERCEHEHTRKERDAAVKWVPRQCGTCKHFKSNERTKMCFKGGCADWKRMENWEWRGVQE